MNSRIQLVRSGAEHPHRPRVLRPTRSDRPRVGRPHAVPLPRTALLAHALPRIDWSDTYAVLVPTGARLADAQEWADAVFHAPPPWLRVLFGLRELVVRVLGIERGGSHVFDTVCRTSNEVLLGVDQNHLGYRVSVLVEPERVVLSTVVELRNRRGAAYFAVVRRIHPFVVGSMLTRAARAMAASA